jgi:hypothetical protein
MIPNGALICPYCRSDVRIPPGPPPPSPPEPDAAEPSVGEGALRFSHSGARHLLGIGDHYFGIWDRQRPGEPIARFPRSDEGWRQAWLAFVRLEPHPAEVGLPGGTPRVTQTPPRVVRVRAAAHARPVPVAWWLLPILLGTIGGVIAWAFTRERDPRVARNMLLTGIGLSLALLFVYMTSGAT